MQNGMTYIVRPRMRAAVELGHDRLHLGRVHPVVGRAGVGLVGRADEGAVLDPGDVGRVGARPEGVRLLARSSRTNVPAVDELVGEPVPLLVGAVAPDDPVGLVSSATSRTQAEQLGWVVGALSRPGTVTGADMFEISSWSALTWTYTAAMRVIRQSTARDAASGRGKRSSDFPQRKPATVAGQRESL